MNAERFRFITTINGVAAGNTATINLPPGKRIKDVFLIYKTNANQATIEADLTQIKLLINGQPMRTMSSAQIFVKEAHAGRAFQAGIVPIRFRDPGASTDAHEDLTALNTFRIASATIEVTIAGAANAPTLEVYAVEDSIDDGNDFLTVWDVLTFTNTGAGLKNKTDLVRKGIYQRLDFFGAVLPTRLKVKVDGNDHLEITPAVAQKLNADYGYVTQANHLPLLFTHTRRVLEGLDMEIKIGSAVRKVETLEIEYTTGAANDIPAIAERIVKLT